MHATTSAQRHGTLQRIQLFFRDLWQRLPTSIGKPLIVFAWFSFAAEVLIIGTGGAVRLTGSGLGCSEWPLCTPDSLVPTPEQGYHGLIEFGNRTVTGVVGLLALAVYLLVVRFRRSRPDLHALAVTVVVGVIAQAIVGGVTVWTGLNPFIVGFHYTASLILVCVTAAFLVRVYPEPAAVHGAPRWFRMLVYITAVPMAVTVLFGVLTTASGPHSGDDNVIRNGFDATFMAHVHSWPGYALVALLIVMLAVALVQQLPLRGWVATVAALVAVQIVVGVLQARHGLPALLVGTHMVLAALSAAVYLVVMMRAAQAHTTIRTVRTAAEDQLQRQ
ncbi:COX15/CtaA family protein [Microbacterium sp. YY-01]|uniref:COX15/CtaA family protein n=1 Tax=Microbacterium sp. YY-01 TaxID=3421634 RepID=UPI003D16A839